MLTMQKPLAFMKYFFNKNLPYVILQNRSFSYLNLSLFFQLGFIFTYKLYKRCLVLNTMFNSKPVINSFILFTKKSNKVIFSKKTALKFLFLTPSTFPLIYKNSTQLLKVSSEALKRGAGFRLIGLMV